MGEQPTLFGGCPPSTAVETVTVGGYKVRRYTNECWTSGQRRASSIHEVSYTACFKPQLPRFFVKLLSDRQDIVYDPFSGRATTIIEAALLGRRIISNDINPLSEILCSPRLSVPSLAEVKARLSEIPTIKGATADIDLSMFYHPETEAEIASLKTYLEERRRNGEEDSVDRWIRMVATTRLTGHSRGFFSVYTLPPNQAVTPERQVQLNRERGQVPEYRAVRQIILQKSASLLRNLTREQAEILAAAGRSARFLAKDARDTPEIGEASVQLTVTSPPFLDVVDYAKDNWLRCWFNSIDTDEVAKRILVCGSLQEWVEAMRGVFRELFRITRPGGWVAFEVGEVRKGSIQLEGHVVPLGIEAGFKCEAIIVNLQRFTKTSNIWGVANNAGGTNTNRIALFRKEG